MAFEPIHFASDHPGERCPYCDGAITREKLVAIHARIREEEAQKLEHYRLELDEQNRRERAAFEKSAQAKAEERASARIAEATKERDAARKEVVEIREAAVETQRVAIEQARGSWEAEKARQFDERSTEEARIRAGLQQQIDALTTSKCEVEAERNAAFASAAEAHRQVEAAKQAGIEAARAEQARAFAEQETKLQAAKEREAQLVKERDDASKAAENHAAQLANERAEASRRAEQAARDADKARETEVAAVREILRLEHEREMLEKAAEAGRDREGLLKKVSDLQRQVENKTANELGDGAEIDLFEKLRDAFPDDRITRIVKGEPGADIKIEILHKGCVAGSILIDSKNRKGWQASFATKLRADQVDAKADHAILSSTAFPKGKKELCIESDVVVAQPGRVCELVRILREQILKLHVRGLSNEKRSEKREALYRLITSGQFRQKLGEADRIRDQLEKLDVDEKNQHGRVWDKRGRLLRQQHQALSNVTVEIDAILEGDGVTEAEG